MRVSAKELAKAFEARGWSPDQIYNFVAIANLESGFTLDALRWTNLDHSVGMYQLNLRGKDDGAKRAFRFGIVDTERVPTKREVESFLSRLNRQELLEFNLDVAEFVYRGGGNNYRLWSVHPDNKFFKKDSANNYTAKIKKEQWEKGRAVAREALNQAGIESPLAIRDQSYIDRNIPEDLERASGGSQIEFRLEEMMDEAETPEEAAVIRKMILNERNRDPNQIGKFGEQQGMDVIRPDREVYLGPDDLQLLSNVTTVPNINIILYEFLRDNPKAQVEHPITGEMVDLVGLIEENPFGYEDGTPEMQTFITQLYYQTDYYQDSEIGRADREYQWDTGGDDEEQWSTRRLDLISRQVQQLEALLGQANINLDDNELWSLAKEAWMRGLNISEIKDWMVPAEKADGTPIFDFGADAPAGGTISDYRREIKNLYRQFLMDPDEELLKRRSQGLFTGETTLDLVEDEMVEQASLLFPTWAPLIEGGKTPLQIVGAYNGIFSSVMGYSPQWDGRHKDMAVQLGGLQLEDGDTTQMSGGDFARWLRTTEEYDQSPRGINNAYELVTGLGQLMGAVA